VSAQRSFVSIGGKGANQAVAAARAGGSAVFVGSVGDDDVGHAALERVRHAGVDVQWAVAAAGRSTGTAHVTVDARGENTIVVDAGANAVLAPDALRAEQFESAAVLLLAMEVPDPVLIAAAEEARRRSIPVVLNPSPWRPLPAALRAAVSILVVNEDEFAELGGTTGRDTAGLLAAATAIALPAILITLGADGVIVIDTGAEEPVVHVPSPAVTAVDTTGCGDAFAGAVAARLARGEGVSVAVAFAAGYAALAATAEGAQSSYPSLTQYEAWKSAPAR
jgi:ribokinase